MSRDFLEDGGGGVKMIQAKGEHGRRWKGEERGNLRAKGHSMPDILVRSAWAGYPAKQVTKPGPHRPHTFQHGIQASFLGLMSNVLNPCWGKKHEVYCTP